MKSNKDRTDFFIIAEKGLSEKKHFINRKKRIGLIAALDEYLYSKYEAILRQWQKAEIKLLSSSLIIPIIPDLVIESLKTHDISSDVISFNSQNLISLGSGYVPSKILNLFSLKINIHPGILPKYKGIGTPEAILNKVYKNCGWTIHDLSEKIDSGKIYKVQFMDYDSIKKLSIPEQYIYVYIDAINCIFNLNQFNEIIRNDVNSNYRSFLRFTFFIKKLCLIRGFFSS